MFIFLKVFNATNKQLIFYFELILAISKMCESSRKIFCAIFTNRVFLVTDKKRILNRIKEVILVCHLQTGVATIKLWLLSYKYGVW